MHSSMLGDLFQGWFDKIVDFIVGFFACIPQTMYFLYASVASLLDLLQYLLRKLAGLDTYFVNGEEKSGDILVEFIRGILGIDKSPQYSALSTTFWSLVLFGVIVLILSTIIAVIKAHYNYDAAKSNPISIVGKSLKSLATMAIVPFVTIFGLYLANILLGALDTITSAASASQMNEIFESEAVTKFESGYSLQLEQTDSNGNRIKVNSGYQTYARYDFFSLGAYTNNSTFSGMLFKVASYNVNRVRQGDYWVQTKANGGNGSSAVQPWDNFDVFYVKSLNGDTGGTDSDIIDDSTNAGQDDQTRRQKEKLAEQIDYAFANNLKLKDGHKIVLNRMGDNNNDGELWSSLQWGVSATYGAGILHTDVVCFSKFNVGLVWYFYDLWGFNWILGFAGIFICATLFLNIIFGLITRLLQVVALFIIFPALIGIMPLDEGQAFTNWRKQFMADILMAFGAIVGMNIFFLILPFFNTISFFNNVLLDGIMNMIIILAGLTLVKKFIKLTSSFVGGSDANEIGSSVKSEVAQAAVKGVSGTMMVGGAALALARPGFAPIGAAIRGMKRQHNKDTANVESASDLSRAGRNRVNEMLGRADGTAVTDEDLNRYKRMKTLSRAEQKDIRQTTSGLSGAAKDEALNNQLGIANFSQADYDAADDTGKAAYDAQLAASKANYKTHQTNTVKSLNKRRTGGRIVAAILGRDPDSVKRAEVKEENGETYIERGSNPMKAVGDAVIDLSKSTFKAFGQITGATDAWKKLTDAGVVDQAKRNLQSLAGAMGASDGGFIQSVLKTADQRDAEKSAEAKEQIKRQGEIQKNLERVDKSIQELIDVIKKKP